MEVVNFKPLPLYPQRSISRTLRMGSWVLAKPGLDVMAEMLKCCCWFAYEWQWTTWSDYQVDASVLTQSWRRNWLIGTQGSGMYELCD
jgi:hypothetical protein